MQLEMQKKPSWGEAQRALLAKR